MSSVKSRTLSNFGAWGSYDGSSYEIYSFSTDSPENRSINMLLLEVPSRLLLLSNYLFY